MTQSKYEMISVEDALAIVLDHIHVGPPARVPLGDALGLVLAEDCAAREPMPPFAAASVDGFAIRTADGAAPRRYIGEQMAGSVAGIRVEPGTALRITTGAPVPDGADAIVMVEVAAERDGMVVVQEVPKRGDGIRPVGQDIAAGDVVVRGGTLLGPAEIGLLATIGRAEVPVIPRPRAAVMSTGDELVEPSQAPGPGQIRDSNRYALLAAARAAGAETVSLGVARDNAAELGAKIDDALTRSDLIVSSGGVSMGQLDLVKPLLERRGRVHFGRVTMKPGKPLTFVTIGDTPFFALPGFPVSSLVSFELFVRPAVLKMAGRVDIMRPRITVALAHDVSHDAARTEFQRAVAHLHGSEYQAATTGFQGSGRLLSMAGANVLIKLPVRRGDFKRGELVEALVIGEIR